MALHPANKPASRHIDMRIHFCRQHVELGDVATTFTPTPDMVADFMSTNTASDTRTSLPTCFQQPARSHPSRTHSARACINCLFLSRCICFRLLVLDLFIRGGVRQICRICRPIYSGIRKYRSRSLAWTLHVIFPPPQPNSQIITSALYIPSGFNKSLQVSSEPYD